MQYVRFRNIFVESWGQWVYKADQPYVAMIQYRALNWTGVAYVWVLFTEKTYMAMAIRDIVCVTALSLLDKQTASLE